MRTGRVERTGIAGRKRWDTLAAGAVSGVAHRAYLGNYRVLDSDGGGFEDLIALGLEEATADGFDVINLSLGGTADDTLGFLDQAIERAVNEDLRIVVVSAGNAGAGEMTIGSPGIAPSAITVGASSNAHTIGRGHGRSTGALRRRWSRYAQRPVTRSVPQPTEGHVT